MSPSASHSAATRRMLLFVLVALLFSLISSPALAQGDDETVSAEPTERQVELNEAAVRLIASGDAVKALTLLQEANYIGELNVTYLNLGRAYQSIGRCEEPRQALEKVPEAPTVESPSPGLMNSRAQSFLEQLDQECEDGSPSEQLSKADPLVPGEEVDEHGDPIAGANVSYAWTGVDPQGGFAREQCFVSVAWNSAQTSVEGMTGSLVAQGNRAWLGDNTETCDQQWHVYCISNQD